MIPRLGNVEIIAVQETWKSVPKTRHLPNYKPLISRERCRRKGGGVGFWIKENLNHTMLPSKFEEGILETIALTTIINKQKIQLYNIYRPPSTKDDLLLEYLAQICTEARPENGKLIICGDLNLDLLDKNRGTSLITHMLGLGLVNQIHVPTRITPKSRTLLDTFFTNVHSATGIVAETDISDHLCIILDLGHHKHRSQPEHSHNQTRLTDKRSISYAKKYLEAVKWDCVMDCNSPVAAFNKFHHLLYESLDICVPFVPKPRQVVKPVDDKWFTSGLKTSRFVKEKLLRKARLKPTTDKWDKYKAYRNKYYKIVKAAKMAYYCKQFNIHSKSSKRTWGLINEVTGRKQRHVIMADGNPDKLTETFNSFYSNIGPALAKQIPSSDKHFTDYLTIEPTDSKFKFKEVLPYDIEDVIRSMAPKHSSSFDGISNKLLKAISPSIKIPLSHLINLSLEHNYIPDEWKKAKVIPLYKSGDINDPGNYRPISLLSTLSKVLEKIVEQQLRRYLYNNGILYPKQYGFRPGHNCEQLLLNLQSYIFHARNASESAVALFIDLKKAFDTCDHSILLHKLELYNIDSSWFKEYLCTRTQSVYIKGKLSRPEIIEIGVPQGSILGPLLFLLYINDFPLNNKLNPLLYADDTTLLNKNKDLPTLFNDTNALLKETETWFKANKLTLHPQKTKYILFTSSKCIPMGLNLQVGGVDIERIQETNTTKSFCLVGVHLDEKLSWKHHIEHIRKKVSRNLAMIISSKNVLPDKVKILLYHSIIKSHLDYCLPIWGGALPSLLKPIEILQKKAIRIVTNSRYNTHTDPLFAKTEQLTLKDLYTHHCIELAYNILNHITPSSVYELFQTNEHRLVNTRSNDKLTLCIPRSKTKQLERLPQVQIPTVWSMAGMEGLQRHCLLSNFKLRAFHNYNQFNCNNTNCFSCN